MKLVIRNEFNKEVTQAKSLIRKGDFELAFVHLERAHVIGQLYVIPHTISHYYMLVVGIKKRSFKEIFGQLIRLPLGVLGSAVGIVPTGNTGGSNISAFKKLPIPSDIQEILNSDASK
ncbi:DUF3703 domain-containing protein [Bacteriovorax sp. Seq25_V]|uniref:DUF3703 domain-containing protein n=1 Tax=Bacteriovorax sp. Seq25_V TaxID=1201288 RepID=UPI00038A1560|nr:DUF3703 domain-containing protein [Bacteriovorax sp. Seq25_V]EQC48064.1 PF12487 family protein [Bacteriovorax sp. Seq25_V]